MKPIDAATSLVLVALAAAEDASPQVATAALRTADALAAQNLAPPALTAQTDPSNMGAYLQIPLPGGQTAEVRPGCPGVYIMNRRGR